MTCAKAHVSARLVTPEGRVFLGANDCRRPQYVCPRIEAGHGRDDYRLCREVCQQPGHAEVMAIRAAGPWAVGATVYVNHWRVCDDCAAFARAAGVVRVVCEGVRPEPEAA
jgi:deoxycytidylate deaminase